MVTGCLEKKNNSSLELSFVAFTANLQPADKWFNANSQDRLSSELTQAYHSIVLHNSLSSQKVSEFQNDLCGDFLKW